MKNRLGMEIINESLFIIHIVTDDDGSLKIKQLEHFRDSQVYLELKKSMGEAIAAAQANK